MVVQRGDRGARRGRQHDPADLRRRPRDRRHADRLRLRQARADADRRRRDGGAGARRTDRRADEQGAPRAGLLAARPGGAAQRASRAGARVAEGPAGAARARSSTTSPAGCRARCAPTRRSITRSSPASPGGWRRSSCAPRSSAAGCGSTPPTHRLSTALKTYRDTQRYPHRARPRARHRVRRTLAPRRAGRDRQPRRRGSSVSYQLLRAFSYQSVLERGFALVRDEAGHPLRAAAAVKPGMALDIEFADGCVGATARACAPQRRPPSPPLRAAAPRGSRASRRASAGGDSGQGSLFG